MLRRLACAGLLGATGLPGRDRLPLMQFERQRRHQTNGRDGLPLIDDPDYVALELANLIRADLRGIGVSFVNYGSELSYFVSEVLPLLERLGLREPTTATA